MKSADYVQKQLEKLKKAGTDLMLIAWQIALLCVGWAYVFGARGEYCTPANRRAYAKSKGAEHPTIASKCQVIREDNPKESCNGCQWYPGKERTRFFDCRGFTYWVLYVVFGWKLQGAGATSQWNTASNWAAKGEITTIPDDRLVCLFVKKGSTMSHTGFGYKGETVECSSGVQHFTTRNKKWTHWALPACCADGYTPQEEKPKEDKVKYRQIRKGNTGEAVRLLQLDLQKLGYDLGVCGVDGDFGIATEKAVKAFQKAQGLKVDGIVGDDTWTALEKAINAPPVEKKYTVTIKGLQKAKAEEIIKEYGGAMTAE